MTAVGSRLRGAVPNAGCLLSQNPIQGRVSVGAISTLSYEACMDLICRRKLQGL